MSQYLSKGAQVYIEGMIKTRKWQDKEGNDRYSTEIIANQLEMLGGGNKGSESQHGSRKDPHVAEGEQRPAQAAPVQDDGFGGDDSGFDNIPF